MKHKISLLCDVPITAVVSAVDAASIYEIPVLLHEQGLDSNRLRDLAASTAREYASTSRPGQVFSRVDNATEIGSHRHHRQVRRPARCLSLRCRVAPPRRLLLRRANRDRMDPGRRRGRPRQRDRSQPPRWNRDPGRLWHPRASRGRSRPPTTRENNLPCLGICLGLQVMVIDFAGPSSASTRRTRPSSTSTRPTR